MSKKPVIEELLRIRNEHASVENAAQIYEAIADGQTFISAKLKEYLFDQPLVIPSGVTLLVQGGMYKFIDKGSLTIEGRLTDNSKWLENPIIGFKDRPLSFFPEVEDHSLNINDIFKPNIPRINKGDDATNFLPKPAPIFPNFLSHLSQATIDLSSIVNRISVNGGVFSLDNTTLYTPGIFSSTGIKAQNAKVYVGGKSSIISQSGLGSSLMEADNSGIYLNCNIYKTAPSLLSTSLNVKAVDSYLYIGDKQKASTTPVTNPAYITLIANNTELVLKRDYVHGIGNAGGQPAAFIGPGNKPVTIDAEIRNNIFQADGYAIRIDKGYKGLLNINEEKIYNNTPRDIVDER